MKKQTAFRLEGELLEQLSLLAQEENRSLNNYVETILLNHVKTQMRNDRKREK
jgi:predicted HicB family RNase H-like nuclease